MEKSKQSYCVFTLENRKKFKFKLNNAWDFSGCSRIISRFLKAGNCVARVWIVTYYPTGDVWYSEMNLHQFKRIGLMLPKIGRIHLEK